MSGCEFNGVVCFGGEDWWYHNRGHIDIQLMRRFAKMGTTLYINSVVMQKPGLSQDKRVLERFVRKSKSIIRGLKRTDAGFWVYSPVTLPVHHIAWIRPFIRKILEYQVRLAADKLAINTPIVWVACPAACDTALNLKKTKLVYQRTDRYEEFPNVDKKVIALYDARLKSEADLTVFVSQSLYHDEANQCRKAIYLDHGVDYQLFACAENDPWRPDDISNVPRPIIGFYGGFAEHTTDIGLLEKLVELLPDKSFVFLGTPSPHCDRLRERKNVWMLGQKPYEQIPHYGKCFDVAIMPWKRNRWIEVCNPIKLKEYLALGKPIVSTPFNELNKYVDIVYQASTPEDFAQTIEKALSEDNAQQVIVRRNKINNASWDSKAQIVLNELFPNKNNKTNIAYDKAK